MRLTHLLKNKFAGLLVVALCASIMAPAFAGAQTVSPTSSQYNDELAQINTGGKTPPTPSVQTGLDSNVGPLPFTGFDVIAMAAVALAVTGLGLGLQRAVSRDPSDKLA